NLLLKKFEPDHDHLIFLGDYADRGQKSVEVIETIKALLQEYPGRVHALKGNHEDYTSDGKPLFQPCTLVTDVIQKRGDWTTYFHQTLTPFFQRLHLALIIPRVFLFVHGGVSGKIQGINSLTDPSSDIEQDIMWSDPSPIKGEQMNRRGAGVIFGPDISEMICNKFGVHAIIRSHEPRKALDGPCREHEGRVVTISTTRVYGGRPFVIVIPVDELNPILFKDEPSSFTMFLGSKIGIL
ncbi:MAG: metallophosphoesterase family protein, partial [Candidatus Ranarchaeia archaeon]